MSVRRFSRRDITRDIKTVAELIHETEELGQDEVQRDKETHYNLWLLLVYDIISLWLLGLTCRLSIF